MTIPRKQPKRPWPGIPVLFGLAAGTAHLLGRMMETDGYITPGGISQNLLPALLHALAAFLVLSALLYGSRLLPWKGQGSQMPEEGEWKNVRLFSFLLLLECHFLALLAVFPGFFLYDAYTEYEMVRTGLYTTHHPLVHVLSVGAFVRLSEQLFGQANPGIFLYCLLQVMIVDAALSYLLVRAWKRSGKRIVFVLALAFLILVPSNALFALCTCKDVLFSVFLLLACAEAQDLAASGFSPGKCALFVLYSALMIAYRRNGVYAFLFFGVFFLLYMGKEKKVRTGLILLLLPLVLSSLLNAGLKQAVRAVDEDTPQEMLTVPIQQLARTYTSDPDSFTPEEREVLFRYMPESAWQKYVPKLSDPVKRYFNSAAFRDDPKSFVLLWLRKGAVHPMTYVNAWLATCYGFWYPDAVIDCYKGGQVFTFAYGDSSYFGFETEVPGRRRTFFPALESFYHFISLDAAAQRIPVLHLFLSPGALFLFWFMAALAALATGSGKQLLPWLMILGVWLTQLLGPCSLPRYCIFLWFGIMFPLEALAGAVQHREDRG